MILEAAPLRALVTRPRGGEGVQAAAGLPYYATPPTARPPAGPPSKFAPEIRRRLQGTLLSCNLYKRAPLANLVDEGRDAPAVVQFTASVGGDPKGVVKTAANLGAAAQAIGKTLGVTHEDRVLCTMPLHTSYGFDFGLLVALILFGRYAQAAQYAAIEGQPGAAAAVLQNLRGNWTVTPAVGANRNMDVVHRAVGRPGVILVGEGSPNRLASLLAAEKKRVARVAYEVPIVEFQVGNGEGQVPVSKLQRKIMRLPRQLKPAAVSDINHRLKALQPSLQAPKGPIPRNIRQPKMPRPKAR
jgi:hypothetical protein